MISALTPRQREGQSNEDFWMKRVRRYHRWHRYNCMHIAEWNKWADDGSIENDRELMFKMGSAKGAVNVKSQFRKASTWERDLARDKQRNDNRADGEEPGDEQPDIAASDLPDREAAPDDRKQREQPSVSGLRPSFAAGALSAGPEQPGAAAEYFDPNATGLGSPAASQRAPSARPSDTSHRSGKSRVPSIAISRASTHQKEHQRNPPSGSHLASTVGTNTNTLHFSETRSVSRGRSGRSFRRGQIDVEFDSSNASEGAHEAAENTSAIDQSNNLRVLNAGKNTGDASRPPAEAAHSPRLLNMLPQSNMSRGSRPSRSASRRLESRSVNL